MNLELESILEHGLGETARVLNEGFADYYVPLHLDRAVLLHGIRIDSTDLAASRVILRDGQAVGAALIARRGWTCRLAGMSIIPHARDQGIGGWCMERLMAEARSRGERIMVLEVIEGNTSAVRLYRNCGFVRQRRLVGFLCPEPPAGKGENLIEVDIRQVAQMVTSVGHRDLPWQLSGESLAQVGHPSRAYRLDEAHIVISDPDAAQIGVRSLIVSPSARGQGRATRILKAALARHSENPWRVPPLIPEEMSGPFERAGFEKDSLVQFQMMARL